MLVGRVIIIPHHVPTSTSVHREVRVTMDYHRSLQFGPLVTQTVLQVLSMGPRFLICMSRVLWHQTAVLVQEMLLVIRQHWRRGCKFKKSLYSIGTAQPIYERLCETRLILSTPQIIFFRTKRFSLWLLISHPFYSSPNFCTQAIILWIC